MAERIRKKLAILSLAIYWPAFFIAAHVPVPEVVDKANLSDKSLHFLAYFILVFLLWGAVYPYQRVNWKKVTVWLILVGVVWYGVIDEWLQGYVHGRTADVKDFFADLTGALAGLVVLTICSFWTALMILGALAIILIPNSPSVNVSDMLPIGSTATFFFVAYMFFTGLWLAYMYRKAKEAHESESRKGIFVGVGSIQWLIFAVALPAAVLCCSILISLMRNRPFHAQDIILSIGGIMVAIVAVKGRILNIKH